MLAVTVPDDCIVCLYTINNKNHNIIINNNKNDSHDRRMIGEQ